MRFFLVLTTMGDAEGTPDQTTPQQPPAAETPAAPAPDTPAEEDNAASGTKSAEKGLRLPGMPWLLLTFLVCSDCVAHVGGIRACAKDQKVQGGRKQQIFLYYQLFAKVASVASGRGPGTRIPRASSCLTDPRAVLLRERLVPAEPRRDRQEPRQGTYNLYFLPFY